MSEVLVDESGNWVLAEPHAIRERGIPNGWRMATTVERAMLLRIDELSKRVRTLEDEIEEMRVGAFHEGVERDLAEGSAHD